MKTPFHKFFVSTALALPICCHVYASQVLIPAGVYDGELLGYPFPYTIMAYPDGTVAAPSGDLLLQNLDNSMLAESQSCFGNKVGPLTLVGLGYDLTFRNIRSATNGSVLSQTPEDSPESQTFIVTGFSNLTFVNCEALSYTKAGTGNATTETVLSSGTVYSTSPAIVTENTSILFLENNSSGDGAGMCCSHLTLASTEKTCTFEYNRAMGNGGAIAIGSGLTVIGNKAPVVFSLNCAELGGAIYAREDIPFEAVAAATGGGGGTGAAAGGQANVIGFSDVLFSQNASLLFSGNNAKSGGAIYVYGNATFDSINSVVFKNNAASPELDSKGLGGAIYSTENTANNTQNGAQGNNADTYSGVSFSNIGSLVFEKNFAADCGGAISAKKLSITNCGPVLFAGNVAYKKGGAICIQDGGSLTLSADYGDIIFSGNFVKSSEGNPQPPKGNAISLGKNATISLSAAEGRRIVFLDPIVGTNPENTVAAAGGGTGGDDSNILKMNQLNERSRGLSYTGDVVFASGESSIYQDIELTSGRLILENGAKLSVSSFKQEGNGVLLMQAGTTLEGGLGQQAPTTPPNPTPPTGITLSEIHLDLASVLEKAVESSTDAPLVNVTSSVSPVSLQRVVLEDEGTNVYENTAFFGEPSSSTAEVKLLKLEVKGTNTVQVPAVVNGPATNSVSFQVPVKGFGYQGIWTLTWADTNGNGGTGAGTSKILTAQWAGSGYLPGPERVASLVPDSLWGAILEVRSLSRLISNSYEGAGYCRGLWVSGTSNFFYRDRGVLGHGYRHISGGYTIGANTRSLSDTTIGVAFSELFGRSKDYVVSKAKSHSLVGSIYASARRNLKGSSSVAADCDMKVCYSRSNHHLKTHYSFAAREDGSWDSNCFLAEVGCGLPVSTGSSCFCFREWKPFTGAQFVYADHEDFVEDGPQARDFSHGRLINLSVPMGMRFTKKSHTRPSSFNASVVYVCDAYRSNKKTRTELLANHARWKTEASHLERHAVFLESSAHSSINRNWEMFGSGNFEWRLTSRSYNVNMGSKFRF